MNNTNEISIGSAGSQPVAWAVFEADGNCVGTYAKQEHARIVIEELAYDGMVYEPLYRQPGPTLTDAEREAADLRESNARLLGLLADIRAAVGDPTGKLMQDELIAHCQSLRITNAERFVLREVCGIYADEDDVKCNEIAAVIDGLLERTK